MTFRRLLPYLLAVVLPLTVLFIRLLLSATVGEHALLFLFMPVMLVSSLLGGLWPGLLATAVSAILSSYFLLTPVGQFWIAAGYDLFQWGALICSGIVTSLMAERLLQAKAGIQSAFNELQRKEQVLRKNEERFRRIFTNRWESGPHPAALSTQTKPCLISWGILAQTWKQEVSAGIK